MKTLLRIDSSSRIEGSHSRELADHFQEEWLNLHRDGVVLSRDLTLQLVPHIEQLTIQGFYTSDEDHTAATREATALSDELISELEEADEVLISSPLYNLNVPSNLKAYFDQVVRVGRTFKVSEEGFVGLLASKKCHLITVKGGVYKDSPLEGLDFQDPYLHSILGMMGMQIEGSYTLEGTNQLIHSLSERVVEVKELISANLHRTNQ